MKLNQSLSFLSFTLISFFSGYASAAPNVVILGAPGSGKGTVSARLKRDFHQCHISTGDLVRAEIKAGTDYGRMVDADNRSGNLLQDGQAGMFGLLQRIETRLLSEECRNGFILDGFPRTTWQAEKLDLLLGRLNKKIDAALSIDVQLSTVLERIKKRSQLESRDDDQDPSAVQHRYQSYAKSSNLVQTYYAQQQKLVPIDGEKDSGEVYIQVLVGFEKLRNQADPHYFFNRDYVRKVIPEFYDEDTKVNYRLLTEMFKDVPLMKFAHRAFAAKIDAIHPDYLAAPEARALPIFGALREQLGLPGIFIRKKGKLPAASKPLQQEYQDYSSTIKAIEMSDDPKLRGKSVVFIDDGISTGGTTFASIQLLEKAGMNVVGIIAIVRHNKPLTAQLTEWQSRHPSVQMMTLFDN